MYRKELEIARGEVAEWQELSRRLQAEQRFGMTLLAVGAIGALGWFAILGIEGFIVPLLGIGAVIVGAGQVYTGRESLQRAEAEIARWQATVEALERLGGPPDDRSPLR